MLLIGFGDSDLIAALRSLERKRSDCSPDYGSGTGMISAVAWPSPPSLVTIAAESDGMVHSRAAAFSDRMGQFALFAWQPSPPNLACACFEQLHALIWGFACAWALQTACLAFFVLRGRRSPARLSCGNFADASAQHENRRAEVPQISDVHGRVWTRLPRGIRLIQSGSGIGAGAAVVGRFGLAYRVVFAPNSLVYSAVSPVFFGDRQPRRPGLGGAASRLPW